MLHPDYGSLCMDLTAVSSHSLVPISKGLGWRGNSSGEGGIRTHAPLRTNGFQDRLVMTTSIPLRICFAPALSVSAKFILAKMEFIVNLFFNKFQKNFSKNKKVRFYKVFRTQNILRFFRFTHISVIAAAHTVSSAALFQDIVMT